MSPDSSLTSCTGPNSVSGRMPKGIPVATFAIGEAGAANAALFAIAQLAIHDKKLESKLEQFRKNQHQAVLDMTLPPLA